MHKINNTSRTCSLYTPLNKLKRNIGVCVCYYGTYVPILKIRSRRASVEIKVEEEKQLKNRY